jgi:YggT family protein
MLFLLAQLLSTAINILIFVIFAQIIIHWLVIFEVLKVNNFQARHAVESLTRFTEKLYRPIRRFIPPIAGIDISPIIVIIALQIIQSFVWQVLV